MKLTHLLLSAAVALPANLIAAEADSSVTTLDALHKNTPSRLEEGYGSDTILTETLPYMPTITQAERIHFLGDIRLRSQTIDAYAGSTEFYEQKFRFRLRAGFEAAVNENTKLEFILATGEGDPVSTNQDFGESWTGKNIVIDIADVYYAYAYHSFVRGGKMKLPFYRTAKNQMLWDNDLRPEGAFVKHKLFKNTDVTAGAFVLRNEKYATKSGTDPKGEGIQLYTAKAIQHFDKARIGLSANMYSSMKGETAIVSYNSGKNVNGKSLSKGNSVDANKNYTNDYHLIEGFVEYTLPGDIKLGADVVYNAAITEENIAYNISVFYGSIKKDGDFKLGYYYRDTQKDAVLGAYSDSDFAGGVTGSRGHQLMVGYQVARHTQVAMTYINSEIDNGTGDKEDNFQRLHLDLKLKF